MDNQKDDGFKEQVDELTWARKVKHMYDGWQGSVVVMWLAICIGVLITGVGLFITDVMRWAKQGPVLYTLSLAPGILAWLYGLYAAITVDRKNKDLDAAGYFLWFYPFAYVGGIAVGSAAVMLVLWIVLVFFSFIGKIFQILFL